MKACEREGKLQRASHKDKPKGTPKKVQKTLKKGIDKGEEM